MKNEGRLIMKKIGYISEIIEKRAEKHGRPTCCRKDAEIKVRVPSSINNALIAYSEEHFQTKAETIRQAISAFLSDTEFV
jgi:hypothetical protein